MSPEQVQGDSLEVDARSDIYALGAIVYELLGGRVALQGDSQSLRSGSHHPGGEPQAPGSCESRVSRGSGDDRSQGSREGENKPLQLSGRVGHGPSPISQCRTDLGPAAQCDLSTAQVGRRQVQKRQRGNPRRDFFRRLRMEQRAAAASPPGRVRIARRSSPYARAAAALVGGSRPHRGWWLDAGAVGYQHGLEDLLGYILDRSRRVGQKQGAGLVVFANRFQGVEVLRHQHQLHDFL